MGNPNTTEKLLTKSRKPTEDLEEYALDGGYAWVVLACSFLVQVFATGVTLVGGVFVLEFRDAFELSPDQASWITSINSGIAFGCSPIGGILSNYFGHRKVIFSGALLTAAGFFISAWANGVVFLCISYGIVSGFGIALQYSPGLSVVGPYFHKRKALALGLAITGVAVGPLVLPLPLRWLIDTFSWRGALIIKSGLMLQICSFAALMLPLHLFHKPYQRRQLRRLARQDSTWREITNIDILKSPTFYLQFMNNFMWCIGIAPVWMLLPDYARESGMSKDQASLLIAIVSLGNTIGRVLVSLFMNQFPLINRLHIHNLSTIFGGLLLAAYPLKESFSMFAAVSMVIGSLYGVLVGSLPVVTSELYGPRMLTNAFSYLMIADGIGFLIGAPITGMLYKATQSYTVPFIFIAVVYALSGVLLYFVMCLKEAPRDDMEVKVEVPCDVSNVETA